MCKENFQINGVTFLENALIRSIFTHAPTHSKLASKFWSSRPIQKENLFPQQQKRVDKTMICPITVQSENMKMTWNIRGFFILYDLQFFRM